MISDANKSKHKAVYSFCFSKKKNKLISTHTVIAQLSGKTGKVTAAKYNQQMTSGTAKQRDVKKNGIKNRSGINELTMTHKSRFQLCDFFSLSIFFSFCNFFVIVLGCAGAHQYGTLCVTSGHPKWIIFYLDLNKTTNLLIF